MNAVRPLTGAGDYSLIDGQIDHQRPGSLGRQTSRVGQYSGMSPGQATMQMWLAMKLTVGGTSTRSSFPRQAAGGCLETTVLPPRIYRGDGFCRYRPESFRESLRADVVGRDQRDKPFDGSTLVGHFRIAAAASVAYPWPQ